ncbi:MAG: helix-turn-helix domain-containing protein, partial [Mycobacterium sp.]
MNEDRTKKLGAYLRQQRIDKGMRVRGLAAQVGIDMAQIVRLEHGQVSSPKVDLLTRIAECLDLPLADVLSAAGYARPAELPSFQPYLRTKYG